MDWGGIPAETWGGGTAVQVTVLVAVVLCMAWLRSFLNLFPSLTECFFRWKGNVNLEESVPRTRDRDAVATALILPFCLVLSRFRVYSPSFIDPLPDFAHALTVVAAFLAFVVVRHLLRLCLKPRRQNVERYGTATRCGMNYFIIVATTLLAAVAILSLCGVKSLSIRNFCAIFLLLGYAFFLLRETELLLSFCSPFKAFLYLCALEFAPTGALVATTLL